MSSSPYPRLSLPPPPLPLPPSVGAQGRRRDRTSEVAINSQLLPPGTSPLFRVPGSGSRGLGLGLWYRACGSGLRVWGLGFRRRCEACDKGYKGFLVTQTSRVGDKTRTRDVQDMRPQHLCTPPRACIASSDSRTPPHLAAPLLHSLLSSQDRALLCWV